MPYIDLRTDKAGLAMIETVRKNFESYAKKEIEKAKLSRTMQSMIGYSSNKHYKQIVSRNDLKNCPVRVDDVKNAKIIFGPYRPGLKGWTTRKPPKRVNSERVHVPREYYKLNKFVTIGADVMFVAGVPFFVTYSRKIKFTTGEFLPRRTARQLATSLKKVLCLYARGGFIVRLCLMDREFEPVKDLVPLVEINTTAAREHVGLIERRIRVVKEKQEPLAVCFRS